MIPWRGSLPSLGNFQIWAALKSGPNLGQVTGGRFQIWAGCGRAGGFIFKVSSACLSQGGGELLLDRNQLRAVIFPLFFIGLPARAGHTRLQAYCKVLAEKAAWAANIRCGRTGNVSRISFSPLKMSVR